MVVDVVDEFFVWFVVYFGLYGLYVGVVGCYDGDFVFCFYLFVSEVVGLEFYVMVW